MKRAAAPPVDEIIDARTGPPTKWASLALTPACSGRNEPATTAKRRSSRPVIRRRPGSTRLRSLPPPPPRTRRAAFPPPPADVAVLHRHLRAARPADPGRGAREDQVSRLEGEDARDERDQE